MLKLIFYLSGGRQVKMLIEEALIKILGSQARPYLILYSENEQVQLLHPVDHLLSFSVDKKLTTSLISFLVRIYLISGMLEAALVLFSTWPFATAVFCRSPALSIRLSLVSV
jgi:hypothetical protein